MLNPAFIEQQLISQSVKNAVSSAIPKFINSEQIEDLNKATLQIAKAFNRGNFTISLKDLFTEDEKHLINSFMKNVQLLVQKTWVEKSDEEYKEETLYRIDNLCMKLIKSCTLEIYKTEYNNFFDILYNVISLLFGDLIHSESFLEYAFRIDPDFGFFWYYIDSVSKIENIFKEKARLSVLLAMFFLANF